MRDGLSEEEQGIMKRTDKLIRKSRTPEEEREWIIRNRLRRNIQRSFVNLGRELYGETVWTALFLSPEKKKTTTTTTSTTPTSTS